MRRLGLLALFAGGAFALTGCSAPDLPEVTFFADGHTVNTGPLIHCDVTVQKCQKTNAEAGLKVRPGKSVVISVPSEVAKTPWLVNIQFQNSKGELQPIKQQTFTSGDTYAYTVTPPTASDQLVVVEVQQVGVATPVDASGHPIPDTAGNPQLVVQSIWSLQVTPGS
ncbi:MAG: hypothetical protein JWQ81_5188 [Amycolatopsis sp.]|jgi:hypothetical protein|uniref:DUF2771 family protein n=1 Tax=Amycolatopsis sp. TaxID=37632 RepID=UPI00260917FF|nr:DUF2771 family protein [Amycolatopsis sp.]MCU1684449.1 hypothetical protein [Amycolatopsis sp.]